MRIWNLKASDPLTLTLAADARLVKTDYLNDQIWELVLTGGEPPALALQTTYGLRARSFRMFPRFSEGGISLTDPYTFNRAPVVNFFAPNFIRLSFSPFVDVDVIDEYWVPESHAIAGRVTFFNRDKMARKIRFEWAAVLIPSGDGQRVSPLEIGTTSVLTGRTQGLSPVIFLTGGAEPVTSPFPALGIEIELEPDSKRTFTWVEAGLDDTQASFDLTRQLAARNWEAESAHIELINAGLVEIYTGEPDWDAALTLAQKTAIGLFCGPTPALPANSFVLSRQPDNGYSLRGDGSDYNYLWSGQSPLEASYLIDLLLPANPQLAQGVCRNFLASQYKLGWLDWKPGLGGQRGQLLATPLLANLTWKIYQVTQDKSFLEEAFPALLSYFQAWFDPQHDRDGDGIPEWDHALQTGFEDHPLFTNWDSWSRGIDITSVESPSLCAFLFRESQVLAEIAHLIGRPEPLPALRAHADQLKTAVESSWDDQKSVYRYWDRDTHHSTNGEILGDRYGSGEIAIRRDFEQPVRVLVRIQTMGEPNHQLKLFIHGTGSSGQHLIEPVPNEELRWYMGHGNATSERIYTYLERIEIQSANETDRINLRTVGYDCNDLTVLLPLWAGIPDPRRAGLLIKNTITANGGFWQPYGIRACADLPETQDEPSVYQSVHLDWNTAIGEGLLIYSCQAEAAELVTHMMNAVVACLKRDKAFRKFYHSQTGAGIGERDALVGLAPMSLFLHTLGVKLFSPTRVEISGVNPFPWPVTVKYRGLTVLRQNEKTTIVFPDGQAVTVEGSEPRLVALE